MDDAQMHRAVSRMAEGLYNSLRERHPEDAIRLDAQYTIREAKEETPPTYWVYQDNTPLEPFGDKPAAEEGRKALIMAELAKINLAMAAANREGMTHE